MELKLILITPMHFPLKYQKSNRLPLEITIFLQEITQALLQLHSIPPPVPALKPTMGLNSQKLALISSKCLPIPPTTETIPKYQRRRKKQVIQSRLKKQVGRLILRKKKVSRRATFLNLSWRKASTSMNQRSMIWSQSMRNRRRSRWNPFLTNSWNNLWSSQ